MKATNSFNANDPQSQINLPSPLQEAPAAFGAKEHILIVDDEKLIVQSAQEMLEKIGYLVTVHTSSLEALAAVRQQPEIFHLVITDFIMPQMNGIELARELSRLHPGLPIILCTAIDAIDRVISAEDGKKIGIEAYLMKPVKAAELHQAIRQVLGT